MRDGAPAADGGSRVTRRPIPAPGGVAVVGKTKISCSGTAATPVAAAIAQGKGGDGGNCIGQ
ncbi:hypothetical protein Syun_001422 [Stephania yunnanensis]|uniref:Uncharacterized protein n=1 Tax=Stephania yunnanensis TaxID=152371 RepID=A0AAP0Q695_9MAGN